MKKKMMAAILSGLLGVSVLMAGCGASESTAESSAESSAETSSEESSEESSSKESSQEESSTEESSSTESSDSQDAGSDLVVEEEATFDNIEDFVTIGEWKGIKIHKDESADTSSYPDSMAEYMGYVRDLSDQAAALGNTVNLDYEGKIDGVAFDGGTAQGATLTLGSGSFIDDFEDQLVGTRVGDTVDVTVTFPESYSQEDLAGKEAVFTCTINDIYTSLLPSVCNDSTALKYPQNVYDVAKESIYEYYNVYAEYYGMELEEFLEQVGVTDEALEETILNQTKRALVSMAILKEAGVTEDTDEYKEVEESVKEYYSQSSEELDEETLRFNVIYSAATRLIVENGVES